MHLVLEILLWSKFWVLQCCCMVVVLDEDQVPVFSF